MSEPDEESDDAPPDYCRFDMGSKGELFCDLAGSAECRACSVGREFDEGSITKRTIQ